MNFQALSTCVVLLFTCIHGNKEHLRRAYDPDSWKNNVSCDVCKIIVGQLATAVEQQAPSKTLIELSNFFCTHFKIEDARVCKAIINQYKDTIFGVLQMTVLSPDDVCAQVINETCGSPFNPNTTWNITLSSVPKPPVMPPAIPKPGLPTIRILQLTDMHLDLEYKYNSSADCHEPLCCRVNDGPPEAGHKGAGYWGDYRHCDLAPRTFYSMMEYLESIKNKFDMIYFTGDIPAHNIWNQTRVDQLARIRVFQSALERYLPDKPVYFAAGNHESSPCNIYAPPFVTGNLSQDWLYGAFAEVWTKWMPMDTIDTILRGGFYSVSPLPGLRIISINSNLGTTDNWWLLVNNTDPAGQLQWLADELQEAENNNEKVHILMHHPTASAGVKPWNLNFFKIVNRYESIIQGHFNGHSHDDFFTVFYDEVNFTRPISTGFVAGSGTTYSNLNPGFRIYTIDGNYTGSSWAILDFDNYVADISELTAKTTPVWVKEYSAKADYNMGSLYPSDWSDLIYRMRDDDSLFQKFDKYRYKLAANGPCKGSCKTSSLCSLKTAQTGHPDLCKDLQ
ncbi:hypothetical protein SNE40_003944 [Patella caerulea]|uniref:Sphingomyelin phosphodiesterase n=1 Tax=Patella caerulea TaxID=87958 RepID=A0AAN8K3Z3_PATCE